jgi:hypothetical protein
MLTVKTPALPEPVASLLPDCVDDEQNLINLYRLPYQVYQTAMERYKAVQQFMLRIQVLPSTDVLSLTIWSSSAHAILGVFKIQCAPSNKSRKAEHLQ